MSICASCAADQLHHTIYNAVHHVGYDKLESVVFVKLWNLLFIILDDIFMSFGITPTELERVLWNILLWKVCWIMSFGLALSVRSSLLADADASVRPSSIKSTCGKTLPPPPPPQSTTGSLSNAQGDSPRPVPSWGSVSFCRSAMFGFILLIRAVFS